MVLLVDHKNPVWEALEAQADTVQLRGEQLRCPRMVGRRGHAERGQRASKISMNKTARELGKTREIRPSTLGAGGGARATP